MVHQYTQSSQGNGWPLSVLDRLPIRYSGEKFIDRQDRINGLSLRRRADRELSIALATYEMACTPEDLIHVGDAVRLLIHGRARNKAAQ